MLPMPILLLFILIFPAFAADSDFQEIDPKREEFLAKKQRAFEIVRGAQDKWDQKMREEKLAKEKLEQEKKLEAEKIVREKKAKEERIAREKKAEEERIAREKKAEEERIAREKKIEEEKLAKVNEEQRKKKEEEDRLAKFKEEAKRGWEELLKKKAEADKGRADTGATSGGANSNGISKFPEDGNGNGNGYGNGKGNGSGIGMGSGNGHGMVDNNKLAEQSMGSYKTEGGYKKKERKQEPSVVQVYKCTDEITENKLYEVYSVYTFDAPDVFKSHFEAMTGSRQEALTNCFYNMHLNPQRPIFCEWGGNIIAEQHMASFERPYKKNKPIKPVLH
jgi:hypothetical protein